MQNAYDVVVVGGGTAGPVAAIQAARAGASVLLVEKNGMLGGTITVAAVNYPALFHAWGRQVIAGIGWELVSKAIVEETGEAPKAPGPSGPHWAAGYTVNRNLYALLAEEAACAAGVELRYHTLVAEAAWQDGAWRLTLCGKEGLCPLQAKVVVDATGDANVVRLAGFPCNHPSVLQPGTPVVRVSGYDFAKLDLVAFRAAFTQAEAAGDVRLEEFGWGNDRVVNFLRKGGGNALHVPADAGDSEGKTAAELKGHELVLRVFRWLRKQPGLEGLRIDFLAEECGIRETYTIQGKGTVTGADYEGGRVFPDAVCYSFYPIDIHTYGGSGVNARQLQAERVPTIPRGALLPAGSRFLLAPGRHAAGDREAQSAFRVEASCMAMGQASGALAALAARTGVDPADLDLAAVRALLQQHGAVVPEGM